MIYAPVVIPTLCRYESFVQCVESLMNNTWAEYTDVYVALDYPLKKTHWDGYKKIKNYLKTREFNIFKSFTVIEREKNYGALDNVYTLIHECFEDNKRCICTFDDLYHSPDFIQYMDMMLDMYEDDNDVITVTGYSYPVEWQAAENANAVKQNFHASVWGMGLWKDKWIGLEEYFNKLMLEKKFIESYRSGKFDKMTDYAVTDYVNHTAYGVHPWSLLKVSTDITMRIMLAIEDKYVIMPLVSKVRNNGFDGTGEYCQKIDYDSSKELTSENYPFASQPIDTECTFEPVIDDDFNVDINRKILNEFDRIEKDKLQKALSRAEFYSKKSIIWRKSLDLYVTFKRTMRRLIKGY